MVGSRTDIEDLLEEEELREGSGSGIYCAMNDRIPAAARIPALQENTSFTSWGNSQETLHYLTLKQNETYTGISMGKEQDAVVPNVVKCP